jgi:hypothetical protein
MEILAKFQHYCDGICISGECNKFLKFISVDVDISSSLKISVGFKCHECCGHLILWAEH